MVGSRSGERSDLERLEELCTQARNEVIHLRGGPQLLGAIPSGVPDSNSLGDLLSDPSSKLLVGLIDDFVVGFATASSGDLPRSPRQAREPDHVLVGTIDHLYVEPEARGVGVGEQLLGELMTWFDSKSCTQVDAQALPGDRATKSFFETAGFKARLLVMNRLLT